MIKIFLPFFIYIITLIHAQPKKNDYYRTAIELGLFLSIEYDLLDLHSIQKKKLNKPNKIDTYFRNKLKWKNDKLNKAKVYSDILLYGLVIGSIPITPIISLNNNYQSMFLANLEVLAINGLVTDLTKYIVGRQRPSSYFGTRNEKKDAFKSFFSGHTSTAFAIGTSSAIMLSKEYPESGIE